MQKLTPPTLMLFCVLSAIVLHFIAPLGLTSNWLFFIFGLAFITFGLAMAFGAEGQFRRIKTTVDHLGTATKLVTDGWFGYSRNPMYLSFVLILMGAWLSLGSLLPLIAVLVFIVLTERWYILPEEKRLAVVFGKGYESYQKRTRRWL